LTVFGFSVCDRSFLSSSFSLFVFILCRFNSFHRFGLSKLSIWRRSTTVKIQDHEIEELKKKKTICWRCQRFHDNVSFSENDEKLKFWIPLTTDILQ
jgi:hypothetical protein